MSREPGLFRAHSNRIRSLNLHFTPPYSLFYKKPTVYSSLFFFYFRYIGNIAIQMFFIDQNGLIHLNVIGKCKEIGIMKLTQVLKKRGANN